MAEGEKDFKRLKELGLCLIYLIELGLIYILSKVLYGEVFDVSVFSVIALITAVFNFFLWDRFRKNEWMMWFPVLQLILLLIIPTVFWISKPEYTFKQVKPIIEEKQGFLGEYKILDMEPENTVMLDSPNILIRKAYLLKAKNENGIDAYIYFDPIRGTFKFIEKTISKPIMF